MQRRSFLRTVPPACFAGMLPLPGAETGSPFPSVPALVEDHFPSRLHQFVWRNWELANLDRMAQVLQCRPARLDAIGRSMGLPPKPALSGDYLRRIYITVIRQNWHLLPESQIVELLGWDREKYDFTLKEDDFLDIKLGRVKPECAPLRYEPPTRVEQRRAAEIKAKLQRWFPTGLHQPAQPRFAFVDEFSRPALPALRPKSPQPDDIDLAAGWRIATNGGGEALATALQRFQPLIAGGPKPFEIAIEPEHNHGSGDFTLSAAPGRIRISAATERAAIRALYHLRGEMELRGAAHIPAGDLDSREIWSPRYIYSYFALYGDPLMEGDAAGLPDGYLDRAAASGIEGVWIQAVLNTLAPSRRFPEFGKGGETRLRNLRELVCRAATFGMRVYLYLNEPRAMPAAFFQGREGLKGSRFLDTFAMCTSTEEVRSWLRESLAHVFREVPGLGGVFTITMSENHTNCFSHGGAWGDRNPVVKDCPRCSARAGADVIAEFVQTVRDGVRASSAAAEVISYDWGWGTPLAAAAIPKLPADSSILSISEWSVPVDRGGVKSTVGEYSMSVVGPGPRAAANWALARKAGLKTVAKTQFNNTWEISAVPYIPVLPLVLEHCERLAAENVGGVMASWTCGGYPSPNLRAASAYAFEPRATRQQILETEARRVYGAEGAAQAIEAWRIFSNAFSSFPYGVSIYILPTQHGPANLLRLKPTGLKPGMILFPYDQYRSWSGAYPAPVVQKLMAGLAAGWAKGVAVLERALRLAPAASRKSAQLEFDIARTCMTHFESTANQIEFYLLRDELAHAVAPRREQIRLRLIALAGRERELSRQQFLTARRESLIGYEASNHYYYTPWDLVEKMLNCDSVIARLR